MKKIAVLNVLSNLKMAFQLKKVKTPLFLLLFTLAFSFFLVNNVNNAYALIIEDFESGSLSLYTQQSNASPVIEAAAAHDGNLGLSMNSSLDSWIYRDDAAAIVSQGDILSVWTRLKDRTNGRAYVGFGASSLGTYSAVLAPNTNELLIQRNDSYGYLNIATAAQTYVADLWYRFEINWGIAGLIDLDLYGSDGTTLLNSVSITDTTYSSGGIAFRGFDGNKQFDTYEILNKNVIPEPTTILLLGSGLLGLIGAGFRQKKRTS